MTQNNFGTILEIIQGLQKNIKAQQPAMTDSEKQKVEGALVAVILLLEPKNDLTKLTN